MINLELQGRIILSGSFRCSASMLYYFIWQLPLLSFYVALFYLAASAAQLLCCIILSGSFRCSASMLHYFIWQLPLLSFYFARAEL
jgi:hypothetical protein